MYITVLVKSLVFRISVTTINCFIFNILSLHRHYHSRFHFFHCLITALLLGETRYPPIGYHHYNTSSYLINSETLQWKLYNSILPHICYCIYSFRIKVKNTFARWKRCHVNFFVLFLSLLLKYSIMSLIY